MARVETVFCARVHGLLIRRLEIAQGDAKGWVVLLANGTGSRVEVVVEEILNHLYSAVGLER